MFSTSKALLAAVVGVLAGAMVAPAAAHAQQPTTVTGCLSKGAKDAFTLEGTDGKTYELTSSTVKLDQHVGHKVAVTGTAPAMETGAMKDTSMAMDTSMKHQTGAAGANALSVSNLKMVSTQCK
jgi:hypothetical protein